MPRPSTPNPDTDPRGPYSDKSRGERLQRVMARAGVAARRKCEELIVEGRVRVNGDTVAMLPAWVDPEHDRVEVDGVPLPRHRSRTAARDGDDRDAPGPRGDAEADRRHTYIMVNKPKGVISTAEDDMGRRTVLDLVDAPLASPSGSRRGGVNAPRLFPVGRLDAESTGLILLTDDGDLTQKLTHPRYEVPKKYLVTVRGTVSQEDLQALRDGLYLADRRALRNAGKLRGGGSAQPAASRAAVDRVALLGHDHDRTRGDRTRLGITLSEGQNREIRRLLARIGYKVRNLKRMAIGPLKLKGLAPGQWRPLTAPEVQMLHKAVRRAERG